MCFVLLALSACSDGGSNNFETGLMYAKGKGVPRDRVEAVKWFRKAALQGNVAAQHELGIMYYFGDGVPSDLVEAAKWHRKAALQGNLSSLETTALMYEKGDGVPKDNVEAYARWIISEELEFPVGKGIKDRIKLTPEEKARAQKRSTELFNEIEKNKKKNEK